MAITATDIKSLRDRTNLPMMECKAALTEVGGDMDKAIDFLRKKYSAMKPKEGRETAEGRIAIFVDPVQKVGAILEMRCESAPVGKSEFFGKLANQLAKQVALQNPANVETLLTQPFVDDPKKTIQELIGEVYGQLREVMKPHRFTRLSGDLLGEYVHHDGAVGVLLQVAGATADPQLLRDVCIHITAVNPVAGKREEVAKDLIDKETEIARAQAAATGKPAAIVDKIAEGKLKTWFAANVLLEQPFVKDDSKSVGDLLKSSGLTLVRFLRYKVGDVN
jgi:elongation factor Ts